MRNLLALIGVALAAGCAPASFEGLQENYAGKVAFETDQAYEKAYRRVRSKAQECLAVQLIGTSVDVDSELYHDIREGQVTVTSRNGLYGNNMYLGVRIVALDEGSRVQSYYGLSNWERNAKLVRYWVEEDPGNCTSE